MTFAIPTPRTIPATRKLMHITSLHRAPRYTYQWQKPINEFDAFYTLPSALTKQTSVFGTSTREDWENTYKNKRDGNNPNAGPGQNGRGDVTKLSTVRSTPSKAARAVPLLLLPTCLQLILTLLMLCCRSLPNLQPL